MTRKRQQCFIWLVLEEMVERMLCRSLLKNYMALSLFARKFGFARTDDKEFQRLVKRLQGIGALELQRSGFAGHSLAHRKTVSIKDWQAVGSLFGQPIPKERRAKRHFSVTVYEYECAKPETICSSRKSLSRQGLVCIFPSSCNQKLRKDGSNWASLI